MAGQSVADFTLDSSIERIADHVDPGIDQSLANAHDQSGLTAARNAYGFTGAGQTVAVIDTGIAYDHFALGGGYGEEYQVVGGWDFAENDANPYDDGYMGSHGTHVAGIVGSQHSVHTGVAPGVDLVALRVFDDNGSGYFNWVEDALDWVHANRNAFDNPITTVNLSLGAEWNADTLPNWANLEDEFAQLEADGIFIAVAAGNSFTSYYEAGLSYPAVSEYVVPVSSVDDAGKLSSFSQRHQRAIAAPGQGIASTVPDYVGNFNGQTDDFATFSGTSMASPYVAGSSVLLRQAYEFTGQTSVTQDQIYDLMMSTADSVWDGQTGQYYSRLNLAAALDAIMPEDDFGSTVATAHDLGTLADADADSLAGILGRLDDVDYFSFTASATGTVHFDTTSSDGTTDWALPGQLSQATIDGTGGLSFEVIAGQSYTVGVESADGLAHFDLSYELEAAAIDWGTIEFEQFSDQSLAGDSWFAIQASRDGILTVEAFFAHAGGDVDLALYDSDGNLLATSSSLSDNERLDIDATAGDSFLLKVTGGNANVDFRLTNLVQITGDTVTVHGTSGDDTVTFAAGDVQTITVNAVRYEFSADTISHFDIQSGDGVDRVALVGSAGDDTAVLRVGSATLTDGVYFVSVAGAEQIAVDGGGGGHDVATFHDSQGTDTLRAYSDRGYLEGDGYINSQTGFDRTYAYSSAGFDTAYFYGTEGNDTLRAYEKRGSLEGDGYYNFQSGFYRIYARASTGFDTAYFYDSLGDDTLFATSTRAWLRGGGFFNYQSGFDRTYARSLSGNDTAIMQDSAGDDTFFARSNRSWMQGGGFCVHQTGFDQTFAYATAGGNDTAHLFDVSDDDAVYGRNSYLDWQQEEIGRTLQGFDNLYAYLAPGDSGDDDVESVDYLFTRLGS